MTKYQSVYRLLLLSLLVTSTGIQAAAAAIPPAYIVTDLGTLGGSYSVGESINASGQVAGESTLTGGLHAFVYDGAMHDLGTLGGTYSAGYGISNTGHVTGQSTTVEGKFHAFLYDGTMNDLGTLGGPQSRGNEVNTRGTWQASPTRLKENSTPFCTTARCTI